MAESHSLGQKGEELAAQHLTGKGYRILHRNWRSGKKELDIVAENKEIIVFAEVKTRSGNFMSSPPDTISRDKQKQIIFAAEAYIRKYNIGKEGRFDIITVIENGGKITIDHIESAFYPTLR